MLAPIPQELFFAALEKVIKLNADYIPPYGTEGSLYIRPLLIGTGATIGVKPADEYLFVVFVMPVGPYFKEGFKPTNMQIAKDYDRAAPLGTGHVKVGGNYAASLRAGERAHHEGFSASIFADAKTKTYIDEAGPANFFGIKDGKYVTPDSGSILPSITNMSLRQIAEDLGLVVTGYTWDTADDVTEEEAQPFTWVLEGSTLTQNHKMAMGGIVPKTYTVTKLTASTLMYHDNFGTFHSFIKQ